jgi:hypothetical protein
MGKSVTLKGRQAGYSAGMRSKTKARDIVPGWPRPRRTIGWDTYPAFIFPRFYLYDDQDSFEREAQADYEYHQAQQRMVTEFLEQPLNRAMLRAGYCPLAHRTVRMFPELCFLL